MNLEWHPLSISGKVSGRLRLKFTTLLQAQWVLRGVPIIQDRLIIEP